MKIPSSNLGGANSVNQSPSSARTILDQIAQALQISYDDYNNNRSTKGAAAACVEQLKQDIRDLQDVLNKPEIQGNKHAIGAISSAITALNDSINQLENGFTNEGMTAITLAKKSVLSAEVGLPT